MSPMLNLMLMMLLLVFSGVIARKTNIIMPEVRNRLTDLLLLIILPCNVIDSFLQVERSALNPLIFAQLFFVSAGIHLVSLFLGRVIYPKADKGQKQVLRFATTFSNANFFGLPVISGLYGMQGILYIAIAMIPLRILMWSYGLHVFGADGNETRWWRSLLRSLRHPCIISVGVGLILFACRVRLPVFLGDALAYMSHCVTPLSLMIVGSILAEADLRDLVDRRVVYFTAVRLLAIPLLALVVMRLIHADSAVTGVSVLIFAMPAASITAALAARYDGDGVFGAKCVVFSTLLSLVTLPLIQTLL